MTTVPGASGYFRGSIVAYSAAMKGEALGVDPALLQRPVSAEVAEAMARGARSRIGCDVGLAATGVAGPAEQSAPVGTVFLAVDGPRGGRVREVRLPGERETVRALAVAAALNLLRLYLMEEI